MKCNLKSLIGFTLTAIDGEIGKISEFYFDDKTWTIRYAVVETGGWLFGRKVLISPEAILPADWLKGTFPIALSKEQVENSPEVDTALPVSRQEELKLYKYYPWTNYWDSGLYGGGLGTYNISMESNLEDIQPAENQEKEDLHLRSSDTVVGYAIQANDGEAGQIDDFILDDVSWKIELIVVDTGEWFAGKKVLLSPRKIKAIKWDSSEVEIYASMDEVEKSPVFIEPNSESASSQREYYEQLVNLK